MHNKKARIEKRYHLTPATTDNDYGPEAQTPINTYQPRRFKMYLQ